MKNAACFSGVVPMRTGVLEYAAGLPHGLNQSMRAYHVVGVGSA